MADVLKNFAYSTIATAPSPATTGTSLVVAAGTGALFPPVPFNATIWPTGAQPLSTNAEVVRVTNIATDTLTIERQAEGSSARSIIVGDQVAATLTAQFVGAGMVNRRPGGDLTIPDGHCVNVAPNYIIDANVDVIVKADGALIC